MRQANIDNSHNDFSIEISQNIDPHFEISISDTWSKFNAQFFTLHWKLDKPELTIVNGRLLTRVGDSEWHCGNRDREMHVQIFTRFVQLYVNLQKDNFSIKNRKYS